jgi:hypothetical protein
MDDDDRDEELEKIMNMDDENPDKGKLLQEYCDKKEKEKEEREHYKMLVKLLDEEQILDQELNTPITTRGKSICLVQLK